VPVEGGWDLYEGYPYVTLRCAVCLDGTALDLADDYTPVEPWESADPYVQTEREAVRGFSHACPHLAPLLLPDPPEVKAIAELELLAGA
jgi:hypothetical protein